MWVSTVVEVGSDLHAFTWYQSRAARILGPGMDVLTCICNARDATLWNVCGALR